MLALRLVAACVIVLLGFSAQAQENTKTPLFTSTPTILLRTPDPANLSKFYIALGMKVGSVAPSGTVNIYHEGGAGSLEILKMDENTKPGGLKTSRTQQGVVAIFEVTDQAELVRRAKEAGATLIERWTSSERGHSIYYIGDWENNVFGFAPRYHNPSIKVP